MKQRYNEEEIRRFIRVCNLRSTNLEDALEEIGNESDVLAQNLGPEIQKRLIQSCSDKWYRLCTLGGGLTSLIAGFYPFYKLLNPFGDVDLEVGFMSAVEQYYQVWCLECFLVHI